MNHNVFKGVDVDTSNSDDAMAEVFNLYKDTFMDNYDNFYFGSDKLIIILPINNYFQFSADYEDIKDCMKFDNQLWYGVLDLKD